MCNRTITISLSVSELMLGITSSLHVMSDALIEDDDSHLKHIYRDVLDGVNLHLTVRYIDRAYSDCVNLLHSLTQEPVAEDFTLDDSPKIPESYEVHLLVDERFSNAQALSLKNLLHDYIVYFAVYQWLTLIGAQTQSECAEILANLREKITQTADSQQKIGRIKPFFG